MNATPRKTLPLFLLGLWMLSTASTAAAPAAGDTQGFLYGRITTRSGSAYEGRLRWNNKEEAFWGDFFNASRSDLPYLKHLPGEERRRRTSIEVFGLPTGMHWGTVDNQGRQFAARFGDLRRIEAGEGAEATVVLKSGARYRVSGGSNDLGNDTEVTVWDRRAGEVQVRWSEIRAVDFLPVPAGLAVPVFRLRGTVHTTDGIFRGYIQWDQEECLSSDELTGMAGDSSRSLQMGTIRSIAKKGHTSSEVVLRDGRTVVLSGTNDVDASNRGIYVNDSRLGRVLVHWDAFRRVDFDPPGDSGPAYTDFRPGRPLFGKVTTVQGKTWRGRLVYDADETETVETLDGDQRGIGYNIPFARVAVLLPEKTDASRVVLKSGRELRLEEAADVGRENAGVLVFERGQQKPRYIRWGDVRRIDFEAR